MKLKFKENPKEWRKSALLVLLAQAVLSSLLHWRSYLTTSYWCVLLVLLGVLAMTAILQPRWFRGWYRFSLRLGFYLSQFVGRCVLAIFFIFILTPLGLALRLAGKDPLRLKKSQNISSYWTPAKNENSLDQLF